MSANINVALRRRLHSSKSLGVRYLGITDSTVRLAVESSRGHGLNYLVDVAFDENELMIMGSCYCDDYKGFSDTIKGLALNSGLPEVIKDKMLDRMPFLRDVLCCKHILAAGAWCVSTTKAKQAARRAAKKAATRPRDWSCDHNQQTSHCKNSHRTHFNCEMCIAEQRGTPIEELDIPVNAAGIDEDKL